MSERPLTIAIDTFPFVPGAGRGVGFGTYVVSLIQALARVDSTNDYLILANRRNAPLLAVDNPRFRTLVVPFPPEREVWPFRIVWQQLLLPVLLLRYRPDVLHSPMDWGPLLRGRGHVVTVHDLIDYYYAQHHPGHGPTYRMAYTRAMKRLSSLRAARVIADSSITKREIVETFGVSEEKIEVIVAGVDSRWWAKPTPQEVLPARPPYIYTVLSTSLHKNFRGVLEGFEIARHRYGIPHKLVITGIAGQSHAEVLSLIDELGTPDSVVFTGYIESTIMRGLYQHADAVLYLSLKEGFGLPPLEAMASGSVVIASDIPPMTEVIGDAGLLVDPTDPRAVGKAIHRMVSDKTLRDTFRARGHARAGELTWERTALHTLDVYRAVADERR